MKIVRVQYRTKAAYAGINQQNIQRVVDELKTINHPGIRYSAYLLEDGQTFMHFDHFENEAAHEFLQELASFKNFATALHASGLEVEPKLEILSLAASTEKFFS